MIPILQHSSGVSSPVPVPIPLSSVSSSDSLPLLLSATDSTNQPTLTASEMYAHLSTHSYAPLIAHTKSSLCSCLSSSSLWYNLCLLSSSSSPLRSFASAREALVRNAFHVPSLLIAAKLCLNSLCKYKDSVVYATHALSLLSENDELYTTLAYELLEKHSNKEEMKEIRNKIIEDTTTEPSVSSSAPDSLSKTNEEIIQSMNELSVNGSTSSHQNPNQINLTNASLEFLSTFYSSHLLFALCCSRYAYCVSTYSNRRQLQRKCLLALKSIYQLHLSRYREDYRFLFTCACIYADVREITASFQLVKKCLLMNKSDLNAWKLLVLLFTAQKQEEEALKAAQSAIEYFKSLSSSSPSNGSATVSNSSLVDLYLLCARIESSSLHSPHQALNTMTEALTLIFKDNEATTKSFQQTQRPVFHSSFSASSSSSSIPASVSVSSHSYSSATCPDSTIVSHEYADDIMRKQHHTEKQIQFILECAELMINMHKHQEQGKKRTSHTEKTNEYSTASITVNSADNISINNTTTEKEQEENVLLIAKEYLHHALSLCPLQSSSFFSSLHYQLGVVHFLSSEFSSCSAALHLSLSFDPLNVQTLILLGRLSSHQCSYVLASGYFTSALQIDSTNDVAWYEFGLMNQKEGKHEMAIEQIITAAELERTAPIQSFNTVERKY